MLAIKAFEFKLKPRSATRQTSADTTFVRAVVARRDGPLPQPQNTLAARPSGDCCLGHPKVKWFASERSPNVPHATTIAQLRESLRDISAPGLDQLYATFTKAASGRR